MRYKPVSLLMVLPLLFGCSLLDRRLVGRNTYVPGEISLHNKNEKLKLSNAEARRELGLTQPELSDEHQDLIERRILLNELEKNLNTETEKEQYYTYKPLLRTDSRRIFFLQLPTPEKREAWAQQMGLPGMLDKNSIREEDAINENDVFIGMSKKAVRESWGEPEAVEVAGNPIYGNERWRYSTYVPTTEGFVQEDRMIYFEGGRIVGWRKIASQ